MRFDCNLQNLSGCPHEQSGWCRHPARGTDPPHCKSFLRDEEQKGEGLCQRAC